MQQLLDIVREQFRLNINGIHGIKHWKRVEKIGLYLSENADVDRDVIRLFALLHDSRREDEHEDPLHGFHAAKFTWDLYEKKILSISRPQLETLMYACENHSDPHAKSDDLTIQICWDSDRLDLVRLDIIPDSRYLYTNKAKQPAATLYAKRLLRFTINP